MSHNANQIERWGIFELTLQGPDEGNPFVEVNIGAAFKFKHRTVEVDGFYDGDGVYRIRFMPDALGKWQYTVRGSDPELDGMVGEFDCIEPSVNNHGPVGVRDTYHFAYADSTPYFEVGTTCYAWVHQGDELEAQTLDTLKGAPFNKMRMCVFPKNYAYNKNEPKLYPFARTEAIEWDFTRFNPAFFQHLEQRVAQLRDLGIEADIILFHPYDYGRWGFDEMPPEADDRYLRYLIARLAAYRNVWWSMANEFDLMETKTEADWDRFFRIVQESDPYQHLRSIHNCRGFYDHNKPWITHASIQHWEIHKIGEWRELYKKPVVIDESGYEGTIPQGWGNLTAQEMTRRFWEAALHGGYAGHGETYLHPEDILWWSKGGILHGQSPSRIAFFRHIMEETFAEGLDSVQRVVESNMPCAGKPGECYMAYFGLQQPGQMTFHLPKNEAYTVDIIDTWEMTVTPVEGTASGEFTMILPAKPYIAVRLVRA